MAAGGGRVVVMCACVRVRAHLSRKNYFYNASFWLAFLWELGSWLLLCQFFLLGGRTPLWRSNHSKFGLRFCSDCLPILEITLWAEPTQHCCRVYFQGKYKGEFVRGVLYCTSKLLLVLYMKQSFFSIVSLGFVMVVATPNGTRQTQDRPDARELIPSVLP